MTASAALLVAMTTPAGAFLFDVRPQAAPAPEPTMTRPAKPAGTTTASRDRGKEKEAEEEFAARAKGLLSVIISIDRQQLTLYSDGVPIAHSRASTGQPGHATPTGVFSIIQKDRWHRSNIYDSAPMFYMQRITWSGVAMHQGIVPNYPASHGCIRLPEAFAKQMWGITKLGVRVIIARSEVTPSAFAHGKLFMLKREPPAAEVRLEPVPSSVDVVKAAYGALNLDRLAGKREITASDAVKPGDPALDAMAYAMVKPRETPATSSEVVRSAYDQFDTAKPRRAKTLASNGVAEVRPLKAGPISVFISRKEGKLYVRKGFEPVFDTPVTFEQPEKPLGTHVYTALAVKDDNTTMRWDVVTMPGGAAPAKKPEKGVREYTGPASNATEALDRVNIPQDARDHISELMSPGASVIISDQGLGPETGKDTDFIVLTR